MLVSVPMSVPVSVSVPVPMFVIMIMIMTMTMRMRLNIFTDSFLQDLVDSLLFISNHIFTFGFLKFRVKYSLFPA